MIPDIQQPFTGTNVLGSISENIFGINPSIANALKTLAYPIIFDKTTAVNPKRAAIVMTHDIQFIPASEKTSASAVSGCPPFFSIATDMLPTPSTEKDVKIYRNAARITVPRIPLGTYFFGLIVSSLTVVMKSNPT